MPCIPLCMHILYKLYKYWLDYKARINKASDNNITTIVDNDDGVELSITPTTMISNPLFTTTTTTTTTTATSSNINNDSNDESIIVDICDEDG